jgi:RecA-family ATPase
MQNARSVAPEQALNGNGDPVAVFTARANAAAQLWKTGEVSLPDAVDELQANAARTGLIDHVGQDHVQAIMAEAFAAVRPAGRPNIVDNKKRDVNEVAAPADEPTDNLEPLPCVDLALNPIPPREWLVSERIPMRNVTLLSGEGAIGKSLLLMQLSGAVVLGKEWIGTLPEQGAALYMSCEEDDDEVRRRMEDVARCLKSTRQEMVERGLQFLSFAGKDAVLAVPDRFGIMRPTPLFERLRRAAIELRPKLIAVDNLVDVYGGKELDRAQSRQFITTLRGVAIEANAAVIISAHPSLTGIATDTGLSGTTNWHNSVRARMYFKPAPGDDTALRVLEVKKNNYGLVSENILLRWRNGVYVVEPGRGTLERLATEAGIDALFIKLLRRFTEQGRNVSDKPGTSYAPARFAKQPEAQQDKVTSRAFADAMERLFGASKIRVASEGPPSHPRTRIVEASTDPSTTPSTTLPPPSTGGCVPTPHTPRPVEAGKGAVEARPLHRGFSPNPRCAARESK